MRKFLNFLGIAMMILGILVAINASFVPVRPLLGDLGVSGILYGLGIFVALIFIPIVGPIAFIVALFNHPENLGLSFVYVICSHVIAVLGFRLWKLETT